jgi:hypothetical protein
MKVLMHKKSSSGIQQARSLLRGILMSLGTIKKRVTSGIRKGWLKFIFDTLSLD